MIASDIAEQAPLATAEDMERALLPLLSDVQSLTEYADRLRTQVFALAARRGITPPNE